MDFGGQIQTHQSQVLQQGHDNVQFYSHNTNRANEHGVFTDFSVGHREDINQIPWLRKSTQERKCSCKFDNYELLFSLCYDQADPQPFKHASNDVNSM